MEKHAMRNAVIITAGALVLLALGPFIVVQTFSSSFTLRASLITIPMGETPVPRTFLTASNMNLGKIHMLQRKLPSPWREFYTHAMPVVRKGYFHPLGRIYCQMTGAESYRYL